ncbi:putative protoplast regeneration and killer toxin resistance protein [Botrytis fragariae]|uniref:Putative protoplast regeneration and killer toxin resistance protein n=1 Tax=Botrytis fragariae TaxID=1964551 RepID=A0A8H6B3U1_9HELO|nr:putative protoplast regeneration and killer toxin resistance protein [Botrytis fragariae]KAF5878638.1 putative protoplast regeneration and killer toxin resistance protein [Botrytis fragariae]
MPAQVATPPGREGFTKASTKVSPAGYFDGENSKENNTGRKSVPPSPPAGRIQGSPMTPTKLNIQRQSRQSQIGNEEESRKTHENESFQQAALFLPVTTEMPYRTAPPPPTTLIDPPQQSELRMSGESSSASRTSSETSAAYSSRFGNGIPERIDENEADAPPEQPVPQLQYYHQTTTTPNHRASMPIGTGSTDFMEAGSSTNRHLTPNSYARHSSNNSSQRPLSAYSDLGGRTRSPGNGPNSPTWRTGSANSGGLMIGQCRSNASLLSAQKTLEMYRQNAKKSSSSEIQYSFAIFLIQAAQEAGLNVEEDTPRKASPKPGRNSPYIESEPATPQNLLREAKSILQKLADRGYPFAQYYLADGFSSGLFNKGKPDHHTAFSLFVSASKHGHAESGYRAALCYEFGWGCRADAAKAVQFYRAAAAKNHPGAMTRLGRACLSGDLGFDRYKEGLKWLKRATESADAQYNSAPYHLGVLYENGYGEDLFKDEAYAAELFTQAAELGNADASFKLGQAYEHGKLSCPRDPALSVHFYNGSAEAGNPEAMMALCAWYLIGAEPVLEKDENEAYEWARRAADMGLLKAEYAIGYFTEMGIGCRRDPLEANVWYVKAAESGDERAKHRLAKIRAAASGGTPMEVAPPRNAAKIKKSASAVDKPGKDEKECVIM